MLSGPGARRAGRMDVAEAAAASSRLALPLAIPVALGLVLAIVLFVSSGGGHTT